MFSGRVRGAMMLLGKCLLYNYEIAICTTQKRGVITIIWPLMAWKIQYIIVLLCICSFGPLLLFLLLLSALFAQYQNYIQIAFANRSSLPHSSPDDSIDQNLKCPPNFGKIKEGLKETTTLNKKKNKI